LYPSKSAIPLLLLLTESVVYGVGHCRGNRDRILDGTSFPVLYIN
jgi:hypothetical protein